MFIVGLPDFFFVACIFFAAGAVKGILGMGLPTLAMGLLGLFMPVPQAATLLAVPSLVTNVVQACVGQPVVGVLRRFRAMQLGIVAGTLGSASLLPAIDEALGRSLLGASLVLYGVFGLPGHPLPRLPGRHERAAGMLAGTLTGAIAGVTGVFVLPAVPFLQSLSLRKDELTQALGLCFTTSTLALSAALAIRGHVDLQASLGSLLMVLPAVVGMRLGQVLRQGLGEVAFRKCFFGGLMVLGGWLMLR